MCDSTKYVCGPFLDHPLALHLLVLHPLVHPQEHPLVLHPPEHPLVLHPLVLQPLVLHPLELHPMEHLLELHPMEHPLGLRLPPPRASHQLTSNAWRTSWLTCSSRAMSPPPAARSH